MTDQITPLSDPYDTDSFDAQFDALPSASQARLPAVTQPLGMVIGGSLSQGLEVRLAREVSTEELAVGSYVVVRGQSKRFFSMITDVELGATSEEFMLNPPDMSDEFLSAVHLGVSAFGLIHLSPMLMLDESGEPRPVKTVPGHFSAVRAASQEEVSEVFGTEGFDAERKAHFFHVGQPLEMEEVKVTLSLERLVERSSGVFGKSGTGKTFLSRLLLAGIIRDGVAVNLIFDMHNEYGWEGSSEGATSKVKGLKQIFPDGRVKIFTLDDEVQPAARLQPRLHRRHRLRAGGAGGPGDAAGHSQPERAAGGGDLCPAPPAGVEMAGQLPGRRLDRQPGRVRS
ncbi:MAG: DUF87 domain-containing protein [Anaerolineae bacterium]